MLARTFHALLICALASAAALMACRPILATVVIGVAACFLLPEVVLAASWAGLFLLAPYLPAGQGLAVSLGAALAATLGGLSRLLLGTGSARQVATPLLLGLAGAAVFAEMEIRSVALQASDRPAQFLVGYVVLVVTPWIVNTPARVSRYLVTICGFAVVVSAAEVQRVMAGGVVHAASVSYGLNPISVGRLAGLGAVAALLLWAGSTPVGARRVLRPVLLFLSGLCVLGVVASGSRGPLLGLVLAAVYTAVAPRGLSSAYQWVRGAVVIALTGAAAFAASTWTSHIRAQAEETESATSRLAAWGDALATTERHPFLGAGVGNFASGQNIPSTGFAFPHNLVLEVSAELGLLVAVAFVTLWISVWLKSNIGFRAMLIAVTVDVLFSGNLGTSQILWATLGLALVSGLTDPSNARRVPTAYSSSNDLEAESFPLEVRT